MTFRPSKTPAFNPRDVAETRRLMRTLPCHVRAKIRDGVVQLHRVEVIEKAIHDLWCEMRYVNRYGSKDMEPPPTALFLLKRLREISDINGVDVAELGFREFSKRMVKANMISIRSVHIYSWVNFRSGVERAFERVQSKRRHLCRVVFGRFPEVALNEYTIPVYEDALF